MDYIDFDRLKEITEAAFGTGTNRRRRNRANKILGQLQSSYFQSRDDPDFSLNLRYYTDPSSGQIYLKGSDNTFLPVEKTEFRPYDEHPDWYKPYEIDTEEFEFMD